MGTPLYFFHVPKTGGASVRKAIGCNCGGGRDGKTRETLSGTDRCDTKTYANGVTCLGHNDKPPSDGKYAAILRDPVTRLESLAAYDNSNIHKFIEGHKQNKKTTVTERLKANDGTQLENITYLCFERLEDDYKKLRSSSQNGELWAETLPVIHPRDKTRKPTVVATADEREAILEIFEDDFKLWKLHCEV
jgi:hypothetical protein